MTKAQTFLFSLKDSSKHAKSPSLTNKSRRPTRYVVGWCSRVGWQEILLRRIALRDAGLLCFVLDICLSSPRSVAGKAWMRLERNDGQRDER